MKKNETSKKPIVRAYMCERCYRVGTSVLIKRTHIKEAKIYFYECRSGCLK